MQFTKAQVVDILRSMQRDDLAIKALEENIQSLSSSLGLKNHRYYSKFIPLVSSLWYYFVTSGNNLQTLGEEYSNLLRLTNKSRIPNRVAQLLWLILFIGGEPALEKLISYTEKQIRSSGELRKEARQTLLKTLFFWNLLKNDLFMIHRALFYLNTAYYSFSHRITDIKYVILRDWLEDRSFQKSFQILGGITLVYSVFNILTKIYTNKHEENIIPSKIVGTSTKICVLCNENRKNSSCTPCGHIFCWECIHESLSYSPRCPLCREEVLPSRVIFLQNFM